MTFINRWNYLGNIAFTEEVRLGVYSEGDLEVEIEGPLAPYEFKFYVDESTGYEAGKIKENFKIRFEFLSSLLGDHQGTPYLIL